MINPIHITRTGRYRMRNGEDVQIDVITLKYAYGWIDGHPERHAFRVNGTSASSGYDTVDYLGELDGVTAPAAPSVPEEVQPVQRMLGEAE